MRGLHIPAQFETTKCAKRPRHDSVNWSGLRSPALPFASMCSRLARCRLASAAKLWLPAVLAMACGARGGQTGDGSPATPPPQGTAGECPVAAPDSSPDGGGACNKERCWQGDAGEAVEWRFSLDQVLGVFERQEANTLSWNQDLPLRPSAEPEVSELLLIISRDETRLSAVSWGRVEEECELRLQVPVLVEVRTAGSALDERASTVLLVESLQRATLSHRWTVDELNGAWTEMADGRDATSVEVVVELTDAGSRGQVWVHSTNKTSAAQARITRQLAAQWPAWR